MINLVCVESFQFGRVLWGNGAACDVLYGVDGVCRCSGCDYPRSTVGRIEVCFVLAFVHGAEVAVCVEAFWCGCVGCVVVYCVFVVLFV